MLCCLSDRKGRIEEMIIEVDIDLIPDSEPIYVLWNEQGKISMLAFLHQYANYRNEELFPLHIKMPCGEEYIFKNANSIPSKSLPCRCGDEKHFVFKYFHN